MIWKRFYKTDSAADHGTLMQLKNLIKRRNVGNIPKNCFDACDEFFMLVLTAYILTATMDFLGMDCINDNPNPIIIPPDVKQLNKDERKKILDGVSSLIVDSYVDIKTIDSTQASENEQDNETLINTSGCSSSNSEGEGCNGDIPGQALATGSDDVQRYARELMSLGLIYSEFCDSIREGDGVRVFRCFKYMLPLFKASNRVNYSGEIFCILAQHRFVLSPRLSHQLQWSRFVNTRGKPGKNIPCDLHMEHMNRIVKNAVRGLGANKAENAIVRTGKCVNTIAELLTAFDEDNGIKTPSSHHSIASEAKDLELLLNELCTQVNPFVYIPNRRYRNLKAPKATLLQSLDPKKFNSWLNQKWYALLAGLL